MTPKLISFLGLVGIFTLSQNIQNTGISIRGVVTRLDTAQPLSAVTVTATSTERVIRTETRTDGTFDLTLRPGSYDVAASAIGYRPAKLGVGSQKIVVLEGGDVASVQLRLLPASKIHGTISSSTEVRTGLNVTALLGGYRWGRRTLTPVAMTETDSQGAFHFIDLEPGTYYIRVERHGGTRSNERTYFPGTLSLIDAKPVHVAPAEAITLQSFEVLSSPVYTVSGRVTLPLANQPGTVAMYLIPNYALPLEEPSIPVQNAAEPEIRAIGGFKIADVMAGSYNLFAIGENPSTVACMTGAVTITVKNDISDLEIPLQVCPKVEFQAGLKGYGLPEFTGLATISLEPKIALPDPFQALVSSQSPLEVMVGVSPRNLPPASTSPKRELFKPSNGTTMYASVPIGIYNLKSDGLPNTFLADIRQGDRSLLDGIRVPQDVSAPLEIVFDLTGEFVTGVVIQSDGRPVPDTPVVLIPDPPYRNRFVWYKIQSTDAAGRFNIRSIAHWTYKLFAWKALENIPLEISPYLNEEFIQGFESAGVSVDLRSSPQREVNVTLIERPLGTSH